MAPPELRGLQGGRSDVAETESAAASEAWALIADAAQLALAITGLSDGDLDDLHEIRRAACEIAGKPLLAGAP